jgi:hypothetical protein
MEPLILLSLLLIPYTPPLRGFITLTTMTPQQAICRHAKKIFFSMTTFRPLGSHIGIDSD